MVSHNDTVSSLHRSVVVAYRMFPLKRSEDQAVRTEVSSRPSQTQVAGSGVEQVAGADDHSDTTTYAPDCGPETEESLDTCQLLRLEMKRTLIETKEEMWRETPGLRREIRDMMLGMGREMQQEMGREMSDMRHDVGREIREMQRENGAFRLEMRQEMCEMQKMGRETSELQKEMGRDVTEMQKEMREEMSDMQQKVQDISTTASHAVISNLTSVSGRSTEEDLQDVTTHITDTGTTVFLACVTHVIFYQR